MKIRNPVALLPLLALVGCHQKPPEITQQAVAEPVAGTDVQFADITGPAGIKFTHVNGAFGAKWMPETMGSGVAFIDYDGDGYPDIFLVNGRDWTDQEVDQFRQGTGKSHADLIPASRPKARATCALYHNNGNGTFTDVTKEAGLDVEMYGMGAAVGDYDNDGKPDLYVTSIGRGYLFHNEGGGKFTDVSAAQGVQDSGWSTSAAWVDYDKDGKVDLFVCHYVDWTPATDIYCERLGKKSYCTPESFMGETCRLYHNEGGKFRDVSKETGITEQAGSDGKPRLCQGKSLGVSICDFNGDGWPDIVVANDTEPNYLFQNNGGKNFTEVGKEVGIALSEGGLARAAMGVDTADMDHSGKQSVLFGNFSNQMLGLYQNQGGALFIDIAPRSDVGQASLKFLAFGTTFVDIDNDGWPDIFVANGHVQDDIHTVMQDITYAERPLLFHNAGKANYREVGPTSGEPFKKEVVGRGAAYADIDLDGDLDLIMSVNGGSPILMRNDGGNKNNAIRLVLEGTKSNRSAIGAMVEAKVGTETIRQMVRSGSSYCSQSELPITLGLGKAAQADSITIHWPSGETSHLANIAANQIVSVTEGNDSPKVQPFPHH